MTYSETTWGYAKDTTSLDKWNDVLISYAGNTITTDAIGNTLWDGLFSYTWQHGRQLARAQSSIIDVTYSYNADGIRTSKTVKNTISNTNILHTYDLDGTTIVRECIYDSTGTYVETELRYYYDAKGAPVAMHVFKKANANATPQEFVCYFATNLQGDVVALYDEIGNRIASYTYDAWGNNIYKNSTATSNISTADAQWLMNINPFRYRGYYYDTDTGLYYLQSRYYNPYWGRFLNADGYINANGDLIGFNMYAYCSNNPIMYVDHCGNSATIAVGTVTVISAALLKELLLITLSVFIAVVVVTVVIHIVTNVDLSIHFSKNSENTKDTNPSGDRELDDKGKPSVNSKDPPREEDGYKPPKGGPKKGKDKNGNLGWIDKYGNIWVPASTGTGAAHGGGQWDVQSPGGGYTNVYPGGRVVNKRKPYPTLPKVYNK
ncbi:MAG: hypothetical protein IJW70_10185 [Clostridia bacterium]|nr:hypothetical protein [Clostridia bacterium]